MTTVQGPILGPGPQVDVAADVGSLETPNATNRGKALTQPQHHERNDDHDSSRWLTVSPYLEPPHLLDLRSVDTPSRLVALAAIHLQAATSDYALVKYEDSLDWPAFMATLKSFAAAHGYRWRRHEFYVVEFRSQLKPDIDRELLFKLDKESHAEATQSGGLLKYWFGVPNADRQNLATCIWRNKDDAVNGGRGPWHKQARAIISKMYERINIHGLRLVIEDDVESWTFAPYG